MILWVYNRTQKVSFTIDFTRNCILKEAGRSARYHAQKCKIEVKTSIVNDVTCQQLTLY